MLVGENIARRGEGWWGRPCYQRDVWATGRTEGCGGRVWAGAQQHVLEELQWGWSRVNGEGAVVGNEVPEIGGNYGGQGHGLLLCER